MKLSSATRRALEITRDEAKGIALSNKDNPNCDWASYRAQFIQEALDAYDSVEAELTAKNQRMWDLLRQQRMELHEAGLITDAEYAALASDHPAFERLADYYVLKADLAAAVKRLEDYDAAKAQVAAAFLVAADKLDASPVSAAASEIVRKLTPADAERSLQVYVAGILTEIERKIGLLPRQGLVHVEHVLSIVREAAAVTARLAELKGEPKK